MRVVVMSREFPEGYVQEVVKPFAWGLGGLLASMLAKLRTETELIGNFLALVTAAYFLMMTIKIFHDLMQRTTPVDLAEQIRATELERMKAEELQRIHEEKIDELASEAEELRVVRRSLKLGRMLAPGEKQWSSGAPLPDREVRRPASRKDCDAESE